VAEEVLERIDAKLGALLALSVFSYLDQPDDHPPARIPVEVVLSHGGLATRDIALLLGKSQRAVQLAVKKASNG
jgi:hypothetical protein